MIDLDWDDFKLLLALSRGGSVAGAARHLGVDSSTISRRLLAMETAVGATLILRGGREFCFTAEGRTAVRAAESMEPLVASAIASIHAAKTEIAGIVKISAIPSMTRFLRPLQEIVAAARPGLMIELNAVARMADLAKGEADIAVRMVRPTEVDLIGKRAFDIALAVYASKSYVAKHGLPEGFEDLKRHRLVQYLQSMHHLPWFRWIETYADADKPATRVDGSEMAHSMIASGEGIGVLTCLVGDTSNDLVRVFPDPVAIVDGWLVYHETGRNSARIRAVIDVLVGFFQEHAALLGGRLART
jgi:DNA-binding transcriptional LysR family regulator